MPVWGTMASEHTAAYCAQRAGVGLIIAEGTQPSDDGQGYLATPGIYIPAHIARWKKVTAAVHDRGGHIFIQIMHAGRIRKGGRVIPKHVHIGKSVLRKHEWQPQRPFLRRRRPGTLIIRRCLRRAFQTCRLNT
jgi:2,4-dienoyl-CoA reductase-like NADH-dependent reductase (Old Yellow Enzyme family)